MGNLFSSTPRPSSPSRRTHSPPSKPSKTPLILTPSAIKEFPSSHPKTREHGVYSTKTLHPPTIGQTCCPPSYSQPHSDGRLAPRRHPSHAMTLFFTQGAGTLEIDMVVHDVGPGCVAWIPAGAMYAVRNGGGEDLVWWWSAGREDGRDAAEGGKEVPTVHLNGRNGREGTIV